MSEIMAFVATHWTEWLFAAATAFLGFLYKKINASLRAEQEKNAAIAAGVQALLRESIVTSYNKWSERGYCPIYAKESARRVYIAYHGLEGNDVATQLYTKLLALPESVKEDP